MNITFKDCIVSKKIFRFPLAEDFNNSMILREEADYKRKFSQKGASGIIESAKKFLKTTKELLNPL